MRPHTILFFVLPLIVPLPCWGLDRSALEQFATQQGYVDNSESLSKEPFFRAERRLDPQALFIIDAFFADQKKREVKQVRFSALLCPGSGQMQETFRTETKNEAQKVVRSLVKAPLKAELLAAVENGQPADFAGRNSGLPNVRRLRAKSSEPYCDATRGGWSFALDVFLEASRTTK